jgi:hypothetical protein
MVIRYDKKQTIKITTYLRQIKNTIDTVMSKYWDVRHPTSFTEKLLERHKTKICVVHWLT